jgi:hypothetical protein
MTGIVSQNVGRTSGLIKTVSAGGTWTLIKTLTSGGSDDDLSFLNGTSDVVFDATYPIYRFSFINIHPETDDTRVTFQVDTGTNTNYNQTITSTVFRAYQNEGGTGSGLGYRTAIDQAQGTAFQAISESLGNGNDESASGELFIYDPTSTTFAKHFMAKMQNYSNDSESINTFVGGYVNTTTALTRVQFKISSGEIQGGKIKLYGLSDS